MSAQSSVSKLSKADRKLQKKIAKSQRTLLKHDGIETSEETTKILCVNNAGLDVGVSYNEVTEVFNPYGKVDEIIMLPMKPYAFVCYQDLDSAERAMNQLNGTILPETPSRKQSATLYIFFVSKVPVGLSPSADLPPGLVVLADFVTEEEERSFLSAVDWGSSPGERSELKHRKVKHFGFEFKYGINDVDMEDPLPQGIPPVCSNFLQRALATGHVTHYPDQLTVNQYQPGQGIPSHIDTGPAFEDGIMSLSLGSQVLMDFHHPDGTQMSVLLPPRSLLIMTGESRYVWSHGITPRKSDIIPSIEGNLNVVSRGVRTSFTFRKIIHPAERKSREEQSGSGDNRPTLPVSSSEAERLETHHVHQVYEEIASHFSGTRHTPWPRISEFLLKQTPGSLMADIGCGNGKYLGINKSLYQIGSDRSFKLTEICRQRGFQAFVADILSVPLRSESFDVCICIAVIHHLSTEERRIHAISELVRVLRPGGQALVYVWAMEQEINKVKSKYLKEKVFDGSPCVRDNSNGNGCGQSGEDSKQHQQIREDSSDISSDISGNSKPQQSTVVKSDISGHLIEKQTTESCDTRSKGTEQNSDSKLKLQEHPNTDQTKESSNQPTENSSDKSPSSEQCGTPNKALVGCDAPPKELVVHKNRTHFQQQDLLVPWQLRGGAGGVAKAGDGEQVFHRFYHVFERGELERLCDQVNGCQVVDGYYDQGNWAVILQKE